MSNQYQTNQRRQARPGGGLRAVLWVVLLAGVGVNAWASVSGQNMAVYLTAGVVAVVCIAGLIVSFLSNRR
ncbi:hypothetical protein [Actinomadura alba]|uniref:Uncharacterized protein n=1 Tax=Actinomadura alba TaxID=406431 RepID=A0ABR7LRY6_9ACTN|nr:hypothetical protein [Actinomadura alba]MBC6467354.1 hypothetical protein [Actinomadura alba]